MFGATLLSLAMIQNPVPVKDVVTRFLVGGTSLGENRLTINADGTFVSKSSLTVGLKLESDLTGKFVNGQMVTFKLHEKSPTVEGSFTLLDGKITIVKDGKVTLKDFKSPFKTSAFLQNWHPVLYTNVYPLFKKAPTKPVTIGIPEAMLNIDVTFIEATRTIETPEGTSQITVLKGRVGPNEVEMAFDKDGSPVGLGVASQKATFVRVGYEKTFADPLESYPELSKPTHATEVVRDLSFKMRDGVKLVQDIVKPVGDGKYPVILSRTPYGRAASLIGAEAYASRGYVFVSQDTRGRGASGGMFDPFNTEVADGKDTLDWLVKQPWCDGNVGMIGGSYGGLVQWSAAVNHHPALKCIIPQVSPPEPMKNIPWENGVMILGPAIWWTRIVKDQDADMTQATKGFGQTKGLTTMPLSKVDDKVFGRNVPFFDNWITRDTAAKWKGAFTTEMVSKVKIPAFQISGTWDGDGIGTMLHYEALKANGGNQWLLFGPWTHAFNTTSKIGDVDYGKGAILELDSEYLRFFDTYLKGMSAKWDEKPRVRFFISGANKWYSGAEWPPVESHLKTQYFVQKGKERTLADKPLTSKPDSYPYDPNRKVVETNGTDMDAGNGTTVLPKALLATGLAYRGEPATSPTVIAGPLKADLYVSTTGKDATFHVLVADQDTKGTVRMICMMGAARTTYVTGAFKATAPNQVVRLELRPWLFAHQLAKGHRLVLFVTSDLFPNYARNPGTGIPDSLATKLIKTTNSLHRSTGHASKVTYYEMAGS